MSSRFVLPLESTFDINGKPQVGAKLEFFGVGLNTRKDTYSDEARTTLNTNPLIADANGRFGDIWLNGDYDVTLKESDGTALWGPKKIVSSVTNSSAVATQELTVALMAADTNKTYEIADVVQTAENTTGNGGGGTYDCVTVGTTANVDRPNTYNIIVSTVDATKCFVRRKTVLINPASYGMSTTGTDDNNRDALQAIFDDNTNVDINIDKDFTLSKNASNPWCVENTSNGITVNGEGSLTYLGGLAQILRSNSADRFKCTIKLVGIGTDGTDLGYGLMQVSGGDDIDIDGMEVNGSDADGIAIANATNIKLRNCKSDNSSKVAFYVNGCTGGKVYNNEADNCGGHTASAAIVGGGVQLSSNNDVDCYSNLVKNQIGKAYILNALSGGAKPFNCKLYSNHCDGVTNPTNLNENGGYFLTNSNADKETQCEIYDNTAVRVATTTFNYEAHDGLIDKGNVAIESGKASLNIGTCSDVKSLNFTAYNGNTSNTASTNDIELVNVCNDVEIIRPILDDLAIYATGFASHDVGIGGSVTTPSIEYREVSFTTTWQPNSGASIASLAAVSTTIGSTGLGFDVEWEVIPPYNLNNSIAWAYTTASGTVRIELFNTSAATRTYASGDWKVIAKRRQIA